MLTGHNLSITRGSTYSTSFSLSSGSHAYYNFEQCEVRIVVKRNLTDEYVTTWSTETGEIEISSLEYLGKTYWPTINIDLSAPQTTALPLVELRYSIVIEYPSGQIRDLGGGKMNPLEPDDGDDDEEEPET